MTGDEPDASEAEARPSDTGSNDPVQTAPRVGSTTQRGRLTSLFTTLGKLLAVVVTLVTLVGGTATVLFQLDPSLEPCVGGSGARFTSIQVFPKYPLTQYLRDVNHGQTPAGVPTLVGAEIRYNYSTSNLSGRMFGSMPRFRKSCLTGTSLHPRVQRRAQRVRTTCSRKWDCPPNRRPLSDRTRALRTRVGSTGSSFRRATGCTIIDTESSLSSTADRRTLSPIVSEWAKRRRSFLETLTSCLGTLWRTETWRGVSDVFLMSHLGTGMRRALLDDGTDQHSPLMELLRHTLGLRGPLPAQRSAEATTDWR
jgi:hypothetical protein